MGGARADWVAEKVAEEEETVVQHILVVDRSRSSRCMLIRPT